MFDGNPLLDNDLRSRKLKVDEVIRRIQYIEVKTVSNLFTSILDKDNDESNKEYIENTGFVIIAMITTAKHSKMWNDIEINDIQSIQLKEPSIIRMKFANIQESDILAKIGTMDRDMQQERFK